VIDFIQEVEMKGMIVLFIGIISFLINTSTVFSSTIDIDLVNSMPDNQGDQGFYVYAYNVNTNSYTFLNDAGTKYFSQNGLSMSKGWYWNQYLPFIGMYAHSGTQDIVLGWKSEWSGTIDLSSLFYSAESADVYIKKNDELLFSTFVRSGWAEAFTGNDISISPGDMIYFGARYHQIYVSNPSTSITLNGTMTVTVNDAIPTPEPATILLFGTGITGLSVAARRKEYLPSTTIQS
jgi:hypothetical protein